MADWRDYEDEATDSWTVAQATAAELVKITGTRFDKGEWSWDPQNTVQYFKDEPLWATFDAVTMAAPVAKWGKAAALVGRGTSAAGAGFKAGEMGFREAVALQAKNLVPTTRFGRAVTNPAARAEFTPEYRALMDRHGAAPFEQQALLDVARREQAAELGYIRSRANTVLDKLGRSGATADQQETMIRLLEGGVGTDDAARNTALQQLLTPSQIEAYEATWKYRKQLGLDAEDLGMLDPERLLRQDTWMPHMVKEEYKGALTRAGYKLGAKVDDASWDSFKHREYTQESFEHLFKRDFDMPRTVQRMTQASTAVARERFMQTLSKSAVVKNHTEVIDHLLSPNGPLSNKRLQKLWGLSDEKVAELASDITAFNQKRALAGIDVEEAARPILDKAGWVRLGDYATGVKLPPQWQGLYVDKKVASDLTAGFKLFADQDSLAAKVYDGTMNFFRVGKTAYNPASHVRNAFGNVVTHSLATGLGSMLDGKGLSRGYRMWKGGLDDALFRKAAEAGVAEATIDRELRPLFHEVFGESRMTGLDFLGSSKVAKLLQSGAGKAESIYRAIDEIPRLDAWARNYDQFKNAYKGRWADDVLEQKALDFATLNVAKYMPTFAMRSRLTETIRNIVPFSGFSHEMIRVWKNVMTEKPHLAFFWSHFADTFGQMSGALAGFSPDDVKAARSNLPYYQDGKKMLMWPFRVDGKPVFLDMSYLIPLANIVDIERDQSSFLGAAASVAGVNVTNNPFASVVYGAYTGFDPFKQQPLEPQFTERQMGVPVESERGRAAVGLAEHTLRTFLPPVVPPGYVGINLLEWGRGQSHPQTGAPLEDGMWRTLSTNLLGMRLHEADANAAMLNVGNEERISNKRIGDWWERWQWSTANGDIEGAERAEENIRELKIQGGMSPEKADEYVADGAETRMPGEYKNYSSKRVGEALTRTQSLVTGTNPEDAKQLAAMAARARIGRRRSRSRGSRGRKSR